MGSITCSDVLAAAEAAAAVEPTNLSNTELAEDVAALRRAADVAEAAYMARLRVFDTRGVSESREVLTTKQWVRHHMHVAAGETARVLRIARKLVQFPAIEAALVNGSIRMAHAAVIVDGAASLGDDVIERCQESLLDAAQTNDPSRVRAVLRALGAAIDSPADRKRAEKDAEGRWLDVATTFGGTVSIDGVLGAEDGAVVQTVFDSLSRPGGEGDDRTASQRRADALITMCRHIAAHPIHPQATDATDATGDGATPDHDTLSGNGVASGHGRETASFGEGGAPYNEDPPGVALADVADGAAGKGAADGAATGSTTRRGGGCSCSARPSLIVVCDLETLLASSGGYGELPNGETITGDTVRRLACEASITRVVTGPNSMPLDVGRSQRLATPAQLKALRVRDGGCVFPGCDRPVQWRDAHHVPAWSRGGRTDINQLALLCRKHHTAVHQGGWALESTDVPGKFRVIHPSGIAVVDPRPRATRTIVNTLFDELRGNRYSDLRGNPRADRVDDLAAVP